MTGPEENAESESDGIVDAWLGLVACSLSESVSAAAKGAKAKDADTAAAFADLVDALKEKK